MIDQKFSRKGVLAKVSAMAAVAAVGFALFSPASAEAAPNQNSNGPTLVVGGSPDDFSTGGMVGDQNVTELDFIKWFVALSGDTPLFDELSTVGDYVYWARKMKMKPKGGWNPDDVLTTDLFGELLTDVFKIKVRGKDDITETLAREGIYLPDGDVVDWDGLISVIDDEGFSSRLETFAHGSCSPVTGEKHKISSKKCTPPPPPVGDDPKRKFRKFKEFKPVGNH